MIDQGNYFTIHAPRQSGKSTFLIALTEKINSEKNFYAINCSLAQLFRTENVDDAMSEVVGVINMAMESSKVTTIRNKTFKYDSLPGMNEPDRKVNKIFRELCKELDKELIVFFDDIDCLSGPELNIFLAQIRDGFNYRDIPTAKFPHSMGFVGMSDIGISSNIVHTGWSSKVSSCPFNIIHDAFTLAKFSPPEIRDLYNQHTEASGQKFEDLAIERAWYWSEGQPWIVNILASEAVVEILEDDYTKTVTADIIDQAAETIINSRYIHIKCLRASLRKPEVIRVLDSIFSRNPTKGFMTLDDLQYCLDLGYVVEDKNNKIRPANGLYSEVISRCF
jgi:hypothetical protein